MLISYESDRDNASYDAKRDPKSTMTNETNARVKAIPTARESVETSPILQGKTALDIALLARGDDSRVKLTLRLPYTIHERLGRFAEAYSLSLNTAIALLLDEGLEP